MSKVLTTKTLALLLMIGAIPIQAKAFVARNEFPTKERTSGGAFNLIPET